VFLVTMLGAIEAAHLLGDADTARELYELLVPYSHLPVMASLAVACFGSVHRPLGVAAATFGDVDLAIGHLERAIDAEFALGNRPCRAMSCAALAGVLQRRGRPEDRERVATLYESAREIAQRCGMELRADAWSGNDTAFSAVECQREGRSWRIQVDDRVVRVPHSVGMTYLVRLVEAPGTEISAADLASSATPAGLSRQAVLDDRAIAAYRRRAGELQAEIDEADDRGDVERSTWAQAEFDALIREIERATGLLGRHRSFVDTSERARTSVQKAIKRALARITEADVTIGNDLAQRVVTGTRCVYLPAGT
jgi:hypothetical protein